MPGEPVPVVRHRGAPHIASRLRNLLPGYEHKRLRQAVKDGDVRTVKKLLARGTDPLQRHADGRDALRLAVERGQFEVFAALVGDMSTDRDAHPVNQLPYWLSHGDPRAVDVLLADPRVDLNRRDANGETLLHRAAREGRLGWARALAGPEAREGSRQSADPTLKNNEGLTPLHLAARFDHRILQHFLNLQVDANLQDGKGRTALHHAVASSRGEVLMEVLSILKRAGADPNIHDSDGKTPLEYAMARVDKEVMADAIIAMSGDAPNASDKDGRTALHQAIASAPGEVLKDLVMALMAAGADPDAMDAAGRTPRSLAAELLRAGQAGPELRDLLIKSFPVPLELRQNIVGMLPKRVRDNYSLVNSVAYADVLTMRTRWTFRTPAELEAAVRRIDAGRLHEIRLEGNGGFTDEHLRLLGHCHALKALDIHGCGAITDAGIAHLPRGLRSLDAGACARLTDACIAALPEALEELVLTDANGLVGTAMKAFPARLKTVRLSRCRRLTDAAVGKLPHRLEKLDLSGCTSLTDAGTEQIPEGLEDLVLRNCTGITDAGIARLDARVQRLRALDITGCTGITVGCLGQLPARLEVLVLQDFLPLDDGAFAPLAARLQGLRRLDVSGARQLGDDALLDIPDTLEELVVRGCTALSDVGLAIMGQRLAGLKKLDLGGTWITGACIERLPRGLEEASFWQCVLFEGRHLSELPRGLRKLDLDECAGIIDADIANLPPKLEDLNLRGHSDVTDEAIAKIPRGVRNLVLQGCRNLTDACIKDLPPALESVYLGQVRITEACIKDLPAGLSFIDFGEHNGIGEDAVYGLRNRGVEVRS